jgi:hypothetical protein
MTVEIRDNDLFADYRTTLKYGRVLFCVRTRV